MRRQELALLLEKSLDRGPRFVPPKARTEFTPAAVLAIIHFHEDPSVPRVILTKRSAKLRSHKSEIAFPGGKVSKEDKGDLLSAALRETKEEIGLGFARSDIIGFLKSVTTMTSNHIIVPFVTVQDRLAEHRMAAEEVEQIIDAPLMETLRSVTRDHAHQVLAKDDVWQFEYGGNVIWGATARILKQLYDILIRPS